MPGSSLGQGPGGLSSLSPTSTSLPWLLLSLTTNIISQSNATKIFTANQPCKSALHTEINAAPKSNSCFIFICTLLSSLVNPPVSTLHWVHSDWGIYFGPEYLSPSSLYPLLNWKDAGSFRSASLPNIFAQKVVGLTSISKIGIFQVTRWRLIGKCLADCCTNLPLPAKTTAQQRPNFWHILAGFCQATMLFVA